MSSDDLYLVGIDKNGSEWIMSIAERPKDLYGFRKLARERLTEGDFDKIEIRRHTSVLVETVSE